MRRMGIESAFLAKAAPETGLQIVDSSGRRRGFFPVSRTSKKVDQSFTAEFEIMRGDLCRILYDITKDRVKYLFGLQIDSIKQTAETAEVQFSDRRAETFDLVVGADGQSSRIRKMLFSTNGDDTAFHSLGSQYVAYFTIPKPIHPKEEYIASMFLTTQKRGIMTRRHNPTELQIYIGGSNPSDKFKNTPRGHVKEEKEAIAEMFVDVGWQAKEIVDAMLVSDNFYCERLGLVKLDAWSKGKVVLVGDAAYCPSPNTGKGTTCAIVGAYILAGEIGAHCGRLDGAEVGELKDVKSAIIEDALKHYELKFKPYMTQIQEGLLEAESSDSVWAKMFDTKIGIELMNYLLGAASFFNVNVVNMFLKGGKVTGWTLPDYEDTVYESRP